jgi:acetyl-CoA C-acetyltransferase
MRRVAVIGAGVTKFGKHDRTSGELFAEAAVDALADAGLSPKAIQALYYGNVVGGETEHQLHTGPQAARRCPPPDSRPRAPARTPRSGMR